VVSGSSLQGFVHGIEHIGIRVVRLANRARRGKLSGSGSGGGSFGSGSVMPSEYSGR
jgi:hypothetical protein